MTSQKLIQKLTERTSFHFTLQQSTLPLWATVYKTTDLIHDDTENMQKCPRVGTSY